MTLTTWKLLSLRVKVDNGNGPCHMMTVTGWESEQGSGVLLEYLELVQYLGACVSLSSSSNPSADLSQRDIGKLLYAYMLSSMPTT
jgi:hypothetical protein